MRRLTGEPGSQLPELGRALQGRQELGVGAGEVVRGGEFDSDLLVQGGRTGRLRRIASAAAARCLGVDVGHVVRVWK
jgi:hypothetical protein